MGDSNNLGDLNVSITGDFSELQDAIDQSVSVAQEGSQQIASAFQAVSDASGLAGRDLENFQQFLQTDADAGISLKQSLEDLAGSAAQLGDALAGGAAAALESLNQSATEGAQSWDDMAAAMAAAGDSATEAAPQLQDAATATTEVATESPEAQGGLEGMAEGFLAVGEALAVTEGLAEFVGTAIEVYGAVQNIATSLEIVGDTSAQAEEQLSSWADMANGLAIPLETLEQSARRLTVAFQGIEGVDVDTVLIAAADSAAETGRSFDTVATALQRVEATGQVTARQLQALGITWQQLADTAGVSVAQIQAELKKGAQSATADLNLVVQTIETVMPGAAQAIAQNVTGQITLLKNLVTETFEAIGQDIAPVIVTVVQGLQSLVQEAHTVATAFGELPPDLQQGIVVAGLLTAALVPVVAALGAAGIAVAGLTSLLGVLGITTAAEAGAETEAAAATTAHGVAAAGAAVGVEALTAAQVENSGAIAIQMGLFGEETVIAAAAATQMSLFGEESAAAAINTGFLGTTLGATVATIGTVVSGAVILTAQYHDMKDAATSTSGSFSILNDWFINITGATKNADDSLVHLSGGVNDLSAYLPTASQSFSDLWNAVKAGTGPIGAIAEGWDQAKEGINAAVGVITGKFSDMETAAANVAKANQDAANKTSAAWAKAATDLGTSSAQTNQTEQQLVDQQVKLQGAVTQAAAAVADFSAKLDDNNNATQGGIAVTTLLAAEKVKLDAAQKALNSSIGIGSTVATVEKNSIQDIAGALATANDAVVNAQASVDALNGLLADGITQLGGFDIATELLPDALDRLTQATLRYQTATQGGKDSVTGFVNTVTDEIGKLGTLYTSWTKLNAIAGQTPAAAIAADNAFKQMSSEAAKLGITLTNTGGVITASVTDPTKASADAIQGLIDKFPGLNTAVDHTNDVMVNGETITAGAQAGFIKLGDDVAKAAEQYTPFVGAVDDGNIAAGDAVAALNASGNAIVNEGNAAADSTTKLQANTQAKKDNAAASAAADKATQALEQHQSDINKAWASGDLVVQKYSGDVVHVVGTLNDATTATNQYDSEYQRLNSTMTAVLGFGSNTAGAYQTIDGQIQAIAVHAEGSAGAVKDLNDALQAAAASDAAWEQAGASGLNGLKTSLASVLSAEMAIGEAPSLGGALGGGGLGQAQIDQMAQALANSTNSIVKTMDGQFLPALKSGGGGISTIAAALAALNPAVASNTTSTTANTTATTANTAATTTATVSLTAAQQAFLDSATAGDAVVTSFADLPTAIQDYLTGINGTLVAYDDTTGALQFTTAAANGLTTTINASVAPMELNTSATTANTVATVSATTATTQLASTTAAAAAGAASLGSALVDAATSAAVAAQVTTAAATAAVTALTTTFGSITAVSAGTTATPGSILAGAGNLGGISDYGPTSSGYTGGQENQYPTSGGGVTLNVTVSGNSITSQALVDQLANKVGSQIITNLRTMAGFKLG